MRSALLDVLARSDVAALARGTLVTPCHVIARGRMLAKLGDGSRRLRRFAGACAIRDRAARVALTRVARLIRCRALGRDTGASVDARRCRGAAGPAPAHGRRVARRGRPPTARARACSTGSDRPGRRRARARPVRGHRRARHRGALARRERGRLRRARARRAARAAPEPRRARRSTSARASSRRTSRAASGRSPRSSAASTWCSPIRRTRADGSRALLGATRRCRACSSPTACRDRRALARATSRDRTRRALRLRGSKRYGETAFDWCGVRGRAAVASEAMA